MIHGRMMGGLAARSLESEIAEPGWRAARLTIDLCRPAPMAPIVVVTKVVPQGAPHPGGQRQAHVRGP